MSFHRRARRQTHERLPLSRVDDMCRTCRPRILSDLTMSCRARFSVVDSDARALKVVPGPLLSTPLCRVQCRSLRHVRSAALDDPTPRLARGGDVSSHCALQLPDLRVSWHLRLCREPSESRSHSEPGEVLETQPVSVGRRPDAPDSPLSRYFRAVFFLPAEGDPHERRIGLARSDAFASADAKKTTAFAASVASRRCTAQQDTRQQPVGETSHDMGGGSPFRLHDMFGPTQPAMTGKRPAPACAR